MPKVSADHSAARRREIVEAARAVFAERGFSGTSMAALVAATGISTGTLYHYFPSKAELVAAVAEGRDGTQDGGFDAQETPAQLLTRLAGYLTPGPEGAAHARLSAQIWGEAAVNPDLAALARERHGLLRDHLAGLLAAAGPPPAGDPDADADGAASPAATDRADVSLAALVGLAALVAADHPVDVGAFLRTLELLVAPPAR